MRLFNLAVPSLFLSLGASGNGSELSVISGGAIEPGLKAAVAAFEKMTGRTVNITFNTAPQIRKRIAAGDNTFDVVVAPPAVIADFAKAGTVKEGGGKRWPGRLRRCAAARSSGAGDSHCC